MKIVEVKCDCGATMELTEILTRADEVDEKFRCPECKEEVVVSKDRSGWEFTFAGD